MNVEIVAVRTGRRDVLVDGELVGRIHCIEAPNWRDYRGTLRTGARWLPVGVDHEIPGPHTPADASLLLLALHDYDRVAAIEALYGTAA